MTTAQVIGISTEDLELIIEQATRRGYEAARRDMESDCWLNSRAEICRFLSPDKPISPATFNRNRTKGVYGEAVIGYGTRCKARKDELMNAIKQYNLLTL